jgi:hypothetical protein
MFIILFLIAIGQEIDFEDLYAKAATSLVQFQAEKEAAFAVLVELGTDSLYADTLIAFLVSKFDTKIARERHCLKDILKKIGEPAIRDIVRNLKYRGEDEEARSLKQSLWVLGEIGGDSIVDAVADFIGDEQWQVRSSAFTALGKSVSTKARPYILRGLTDSIQVVRKSAYYALSQIAAESDIDLFVEGLDDEFYGVRQVATQGLENIGAACTSPLIGQLGANTLMDYYIIKALSRISDITEYIDFVLKTDPGARLCFYETVQDEQLIPRLIELENDVFLRNFLENKK